MNNLEKHLKIGIYIAIACMIICAGCVVFFTISTWKNAYEKNQAEIQYTQKLTEQIGKDQVVVQKHEYKSIR